MRAGSRLIIIAGLSWLALAAPPALAQNSADAPAAVGPDPLRDFTLNGTVTRRPEPAAPQTPARPRPSTNPPAGGSATTSSGRERAAPPGGTGPAGSSVTVDLPPPEPAPSETATPSPAPGGVSQPQAPAGPPLGSQPGLAPLPLPPAANQPVEDDPFSLLPWLLAALVLGAGAAAYAWRQRGKPGYAAAGPIEMFVPPPDRPPPSSPEAGRAQRLPDPVPAPPPARPAAPIGIVSTRLRPWLDIDLTPIRCVVAADSATIEFEVVAFNSGAVPARDVLLEACMFNAGPDQDREIGGFFAHPVGQGQRIPVIPQLKRVPFRSAVSLPLAQVRQFEVEGRRLFVPLIGINAIYGWSAGSGQTSASYLIGRETDGERMAPFRLDLGARQFRGLGARLHNVAVRS